MPGKQVRFSDHVVIVTTPEVIGLSSLSLASTLSVSPSPVSQSLSLSMSSSSSSSSPTPTTTSSLASSPQSPPSWKRCPSSWWSDLEMKQFRQVAKLVSRDTRQKSWLTTSFEAEYHRCSRIADAHTDSDETTLQCTLQHLKPSQALVDWCIHGHCKRGLEQWSSTTHHALRRMAATKARDRVISIQTHCDALLIQQISERSTRTSRVFARLLGQADADALAS